MRQSKRIGYLLGIIALALIGISNPALAQNAGGPTTQPGFPGGPGGGRRNFDPAQFMKMFTDRLKDQMGVSDEDWVAIEPKIEKVMTAQREASGQGQAMGRMFFGGGGGPGGAGAQDVDESKLSPTAKAARDLQRSIDANAGPDELSTKMAAYRAAQAAARQQLTDARTSLKELLTHKQEAILLMFGILE